ncbi:MAG: pyruvate dehydrogenase (acetyl-transferring), homodimeric type [Phycisphaerae bacterium]|jgi:pyruvate dehydrogenase E1 component
MPDNNPEIGAVEYSEWLKSLSDVLETHGPVQVKGLLNRLLFEAQKHGISVRPPLSTPYVNTISTEDTPPYPGRREYERRIKSWIRWNAMAMVVRANRELSGIGGHISSYASCATLWEVGFQHFWRGREHEQGGDIIYFQGHAAPGVYARAYLEGRLSAFDLENFRQELSPDGGLPSYPHPRLMPDFWQFPTVSMGLSPIMSIYQARFNKYLENRGLKKPSNQKVWALLGDGEMDEPESLGAISLAGRDKLDNLIFVVNCNLQRLDGPVRGNAKIVQELETVFSGAGWNVIKVLWGSGWDPLLEKDITGLLAKRLEEVPDGQFQKYAVSGGAYIRKDFFGKEPQLLELVKNYSDEQLEKLQRGGHDPAKVYAAFRAAVEHKGSPTVVLAQTLKGYGLGEAGEGRNITHQQKKLNEDELLEFRSRFGIPIADGEVQEAPFYRPLAEDNKEIQYLHQQRQKLGGYVPSRKVDIEPLKTPDEKLFEEFYNGSGEREVATTMVMVRMLSKLLADKEIGKYIVPIVPDEARTFGMESLFRQFGIYSPMGQLYEPVDKESLLFYNEEKDGAIIEEGITEAGSMSSFLAAGTAYATHGLNMIPFYLFYSIFGCQRMLDLIWAAGDSMAKGFLVGGISGRTTLAGEGLQHQDGQSHHIYMAVPNLKCYDPAYAYELAVIVRDGLSRMYEKQENIFYYITIMNEFYEMPAMPDGVREGILKGLYRLKTSTLNKAARVNLFGSGTILNQAIEAQKLLESKYQIPADVYSVTSYKELYLDCTATERENLLHPADKPKQSYLQQTFADSSAVFVAASDYMKTLPLTIAKWLPGKLIALGTDGFGRSDTRDALRDYFEVDYRYIAMAALNALAAEGKIDSSLPAQAIKDLEIDPDKNNPLLA